MLEWFDGLSVGTRLVLIGAMVPAGLVGLLVWRWVEDVLEGRGAWRWYGGGRKERKRPARPMDRWPR